ncbi:hypothetical protein AG4045_022157 [Apium graveolens]|uniref:FCP1 homology domain-containing protein n=1 Tax=Apium graveolens TaxID=4045 RepID=A0A6L5B9M6_APIGR|nr:hypothetical protein AG4045_022157 [Apium graveolens]
MDLSKELKHNKSNVQDAQPHDLQDAQPHVEKLATLVGQLISIKKIFQTHDSTIQSEADVLDAQHEEAVSLKRELFKDSQIYKLLGVKEGSGCSAALIQLFCDFFDQERGIFKIKEGIEISFCAHRVADSLSINHTGKPIREFEMQGKDKMMRLPPFVDSLKQLYVSKNEKKEKKDRNDKEKHKNRIKRELSCHSLIEILRRMPVETDEQKDQYKQLVRLFVVDQIFLPSSENAYIRSGNYKYCVDASTFESINWAQAILDRIYEAVKKNTRTFSACSTVFQALIYDKIPKLVLEDMKLKSALVPAYKYPVIRRKKEIWKLKLDELNSEDINKCGLCSQLDHGLDHGHHTPLFQKACEGVMLAHVIGQARQALEGSLEGDYLSEINDFGLVEDLKTQYLGIDDRDDWRLIEALSMKDACRYTEPEALLINLSSTPKTLNIVTVHPQIAEPSVEQPVNVLGPEQRGEMSVHQNLDKPKEPVESVMELEETAKQLKNTLGTEQPEGPVDKNEVETEGTAGKLKNTMGPEQPEGTKDEPMNTKEPPETVKHKHSVVAHYLRRSSRIQKQGTLLDESNKQDDAERGRMKREQNEILIEQKRKRSKSVDDSSYFKKTLILDINGILADIVPENVVTSSRTSKQYKILKNKAGKNYMRNLDPVIDYVFGNNYKSKLAFQWDQEHCTNTGLKVAGNNHKPLFLKEIKKLWEDPELRKLHHRSCNPTIFLFNINNFERIVRKPIKI